MRDREIASAPEPWIVAEKLLKILGRPHPRAFYVVGRRAGWKHFLIRHLPRGALEARVRRLHRKG
jgi:hypothetical protein